MFSLCSCCRRTTSKADDGDVYGIVNPSVPTTTDTVDGGTVQFRNGLSKKVNDRHSLPAHVNGKGNCPARISAPGRALPQLPGDLYSAIDKSRKDSIRFVDDLANPMYESIDPDADSFIDPLYSKVGDPISSRRERKYDYPIFAGRRNEPGTSRQPDETYQSASQVYGSEDPYSSITSSVRAAGAEYGDEDSSSAYDPGYAKVQNNNQQKMDRLERKERELDHLYSKISRNPRDPDEDPGPRGNIELQQAHQELPVLSMFNPVAPVEIPSTDSREPSYRYITVRENAERVRERLRQQGQLDPPVREHYYSTIGNEYDTIQGGGSTYGLLTHPINQHSLMIQTEPSGSNYAPPPPTSPIPHRLDYTESHLTNERHPPAYAIVNKKRNSTPSSGQGQGWNPLNLSTATSFAGLNRSFNGIPFHSSTSPVVSSSTSVQGIKEFMQKPVLPYETILGMKVIEEKEIVEQRMTQSTGPTLDNPHVHRVEINQGPSVDMIISGRRYRGASLGTNEATSLSTEAPPSARSNLPLSINRSETSRLSELAVQRKQRSLDIEPSENRTSAPVDKSKKRNRKDSGSSRNSLLSTIYTANDYISPVDISPDPNERPWPISRDVSPSANNRKES